MKRTTIAALFFGVILFAGFSVAKHFWRGTTLSQPVVCERWGNTKFEASKFKAGSEKVKASMACSLLKDFRSVVGKRPLEVRELLGDPSGFYFNDTLPTYIIETGDPAKVDTWQLVFMLDRDEKVNEVFVHKNCCDR